MCLKCGTQSHGVEMAFKGTLVHAATELLASFTLLTSSNHSEYTSVCAKYPIHVL